MLRDCTPKLFSLFVYLWELIQEDLFISTRKVVFLTVHLFQSQLCNVFANVDTLKSFHSKAKITTYIFSATLYTRN